MIANNVLKSSYENSPENFISTWVNTTRVYETERKIRRVKAAGGEYYEYLVSIPREWVEAVARDFNISLNEAEEKALYLLWRYNGKIEGEPKLVRKEKETVKNKETSKSRS